LPAVYRGFSARFTPLLRDVLDVPMHAPHALAMKGLASSIVFGALTVLLWRATKPTIDKDGRVQTANMPRAPRIWAVALISVPFLALGLYSRARGWPDWQGLFLVGATWLVVAIVRWLGFFREYPPGVGD
jgi:hypothetical protein